MAGTSSEPLRIEIGDRSIDVSNADKVLFPESGITKGELASYYARVAEVMVPHVRDRPITLVRHPSGIGSSGFFQKNTPDHYPTWIPRVELPKKGGVVHHAVVDQPAALVYFAQQNVITPHIGLARIDDLGHPDLLAVDLDPSDDDFDRLRHIAHGVRAALDQAGLVPHLQLTGSKGIHVVAPLDRTASWSDVQRFGQALTSLLLQRFPDDVTVEFSKDERGDRIYLDLARNNPAATIAAPYGVRAREGAPVVAPIDWSELDEAGTTPQRFTIRSMVERLDRRPDPWVDLADAARPLPAA